MRRVLPLGLSLAGLLAAQFQLPPPGGAPPQELSKPVEKPPEKPVLANNGRPMVVSYRCAEEDMTWAGLACSEDEPCRFYLELAAVEPLGNKIFLAGNIHSSSTTLSSIFLASEDSGKTWIEPFERIRGGGLDHIQFVDFENGWVSGQVLQPLPQDPFLLITSDGGKTWRRRPVFGESRGGSILQFGFGSKTAGSLVIDRGEPGDSGRYELYETPNGGETWMLREITDRQPKIPRAGTGNPDWRLRPDAATKSFRVEHRQGERWTSLASFAIPIGTCTAPERERPQAPAAVETPSAEPAPAPAPPVKPPPSLRKPRP